MAQSNRLHDAVAWLVEVLCRGKKGANSGMIIATPALWDIYMGRNESIFDNVKGEHQDLLWEKGQILGILMSWTSRYVD